MKILVVDDEFVSRRKMEQIMKNFGDCVAVATGAEAIAAFRDAWDRWAPFDLITLDVSMSDMDGTEVLYKIRQMEVAHDIVEQNRVKVMMATARSDKSTVATSIQAGCDAYILKPFDRDTVRETLAKVWRE
jgi:two-component system chemotaxis response regulator CheY